MKLIFMRIAGKRGWVQRAAETLWSWTGPGPEDLMGKPSWVPVQTQERRSETKGGFGTQEGCGHQPQSRCCCGQGWLSSPATVTWWPWGGWLPATRKGWWFGCEEWEQRLYFITKKKLGFEGREYSYKCSALWQKHGEGQKQPGGNWMRSQSHPRVMVRDCTPAHGMWKIAWQLQGRGKETNLYQPRTKPRCLSWQHRQCLEVWPPKPRKTRQPQWKKTEGFVAACLIPPRSMNVLPPLCTTMEPGTEGLSSSCSLQTLQVVCAHGGLGHQQPQPGGTSHCSGTGVQQRQSIQLDEMQFNSSRPFPARIVPMDTALETFPFAAPSPWSSAKQIVHSLSHQTRPRCVSAPPQHPPVLIQVKAGGKWQILST